MVMVVELVGREIKLGPQRRLAASPFDGDDGSGRDMAVEIPSAGARS